MKKEEKEVSIRGELLYNVVGMRTKLLKEEPFKVKREKKISWLKTEGFELREFDFEGIPMKWLLAKNNKKKRIVLQLHGGAYILSLNEDLFQRYRFMAKLYSKANEDADVLTIDYRVAPENRYPAALEDSVKAYQWILNQGYQSEQIIIVGDSAGGGLAIATAMYLRDHQILLPKALIALSAWTNLAATGKSMKENYEVDPVFGMNEKAGSFFYQAEYAKGSHVKNPYISPVFGDFEDMPSMLLQVGEKEMLLSDTLDVAKKAKRAGVYVEQTTYQGMIHEFQMAGSLLPEAEKAWREVEGFLQRVYKEKEKTK